MPIDTLKKEKDREKVVEDFKKFVEEEEKLRLKLQNEEAFEIIRRRKDFVRRLEFERREASLSGVVLKVFLWFL